ncbi:MAG: hypothetical protein ACOYZ7_04785 [Chloroflexota bacterium]
MRFIAAGLAVWVLALLLYSTELTFPAFGMAWHSADGEIYAVARGSAAQQAGIQNGDRLLTLEGAPLAQRQLFREAWQALSPGDVAVMEISRRGDVWIAEFRAESGFPFLDGYAVYYLVGGLFWLAGMAVFFSGTLDAPAARVYLLFCLAAGVALFTNTRINVTYTAWSGLVQRLATGLSMGALLHFSLLFPEDKRRRIRRLRLLLAGLYLPGLMLGLAAGYIVAWRRFDIHWISNLPFVAFGVVFVLWVYSLWHTHRTTDLPDIRLHLREMAGGMTLTLAPFVMLVVPGALIGRAIVDMRIVTAALAAFPLALTYAILRSRPSARLNLWVRQSFVYLGLGVVFSLAYVAAALIISWLWWDVVLNGIQLTIGWLAALLAALLTALLRSGIDRWVSRWLFAENEIERQA